VVAAADRTQRTSRDSAREDLSTASADPATDDSATSNSADEGQISADPQEISTLTAELRVLLDGSEPNLALQVAPAPPTAEEIAAERQQTLAAQMDQWADSTSGYSNGKLPESILCSVDFAPSARLRCDAAHQLEALNAAYRERFGRDLGITDSYRSYSEQVATKRAKGYLAATPGTSNHGWGQAIDTDIDSYGTAYEWMRENAPAYGWDNPTWARPGGAKHEPWHWEFGTQ
jgi:LAS superfamily LD-carboxypeptidase LdcB